MSTTITWLGHATFLVETSGERVLIDPFLDDNPSATVKASEVEADWLLITHGHFDHMADAVAIATRTGARVVANFEVCNWLQRKGVDPDKTVPINPGGGADCSFGRVTMTIAHHSSSLPDGSYGGVAGGLVLDLADGRVYFAGDTALFLDMKLIGLKKLDMAVLPIGDKFTMGPDDALEAVKFLNPKRVVPCHYNTMPPIEQDAAAWADRVRQQTAADPVVLAVGEGVTL